MVEAIFESIDGDPECDGRKEGIFGSKRMSLDSLCSSTEYRIDLNFENCSEHFNASVRTPLKFPSSPQNFRSVSVTNSTIFLEWEEPSPFTGSILYYTVKCNECELIEVNATDLFLNLTQLKPFTAYNVKVRAQTRYGSGSWSEEKEIWTAEGVPFSPEILWSDTIINAGSIYLVWQDPANSTGPILYYTVKCQNCEPTNINTTTPFLNMTGLKPYSSYKVKVRAQTAVGSGTWSEEKEIQTAIEVPHPPRNFRNVSVTNISIHLMWEEPQPCTGPILYYTVHCIGCQGIQTNTTELFLKLMNLKPFAIYKLKVRAQTAAGSGSWSEEKMIQTTEGVPNPPGNFHNHSVTNISIYLLWEEPQPSTGPVLNYTVNCIGCKCLQTNTTKLFLNITNLKPFTTYKLKVRAQTRAGSGNWTEEKQVRTAEGVPYPPTNIRNESFSNLSIFLKWEEPVPSTGPILFYTVQCMGCRWTEFTSTHSSLNITNLEPFTVYSLKVHGSTVSGSGRWSEEIKVQTAIGVPKTPQNFRSKSLTSKSIYMTWDKLEPSTGPILYYTVECSGLQSNTTNVFLNITDLKPYTVYKVKVQAHTEAGGGCWSEEKEVRTAVGVPEPARFIKILSQPLRRAIVLWTTSGPYPGPVRFSLQAWKYPGLCSTRSSKEMAQEVTGSKSLEEWENVTQSNVVKELSPFASYFFLIVLRTLATDYGIESAPSLNITIAPEAAGPPTDLIADCNSSSTEAIVTWNPPKDPNGIIQSYCIEYSTEDKFFTKTVLVRDPCQEINYVLKDLRPECPYSIGVHAKVVNVTSPGKVTYNKEVCILPPGIPLLGNSSRVFADTFGPNQLSVEWTQDLFSDRMGAIDHYALLVGKQNSLGDVKNGTVFEAEPPWSKFNEGISDFYQATPSLWNPFKQRNYSMSSDPLQCQIVLKPEENESFLRCLVGAETICPETEIYCNGPLFPDTLYELKIRAFTRGGYTETQLLYGRTGSKPIGSTVILIVLLLLFTFFFMGFGYFLKKKGYLKPLLDGLPSVRVIQDVKPTNETHLEVLEDYRSPRPIKTKNFDSHMKRMMSDSHLLFALEFELLKKESPHLPCSVAEMDENRSKNRWMNIFPFDHSRVKLLPLCDDPGSDYINANYIPGYLSRREYIATQGPIIDTVDDFWRMIWEQSVSLVIMLTQCVERGKKKCEQYWPECEKAKCYGDLQVTTVSESNLKTCIIRILKMQLGSYERHVKQMHFTNWPDFGCPERPEDLVNFVKTVREHMHPHKSGPTLIHCSAGVGRTGTFIAVDRLRLQLQSSHLDDEVDIYGTVLELRNHRTNMVQTEDQYIYIHLCIQQLIHEREQLTASDYENVVYSNVGKELEIGL